MKLCKLKLKNLNSFREEIELDFEKSPLDEASLVAITGPTGAGKTTLLDAICVALYGKTPRLTGFDTQNPRYLISHGETDCHAEVHFVANGVRYLAEWNLKRGNSPNGQLISAENGEVISDKLSTRGKTLGASESTISEEIKAILGLDFDAFKRSVMLAQGEFAAFLKADLKSRREILEKTVGIGIYNKLNDKLNEKENEARDAHSLLDHQLGAVPEASHEKLAEAKAELDRLQTSSNELSAKSDKIQKEKEREKKRAEDSAKLQSSEKRQEALLNQQPMIEALEAERERANLANRLLLEKQAFDTAKSELRKAEVVLRQAKIEFADAQKQFEENQADFDEKDQAYQTAQTASEQKTETYREAKSDVARANTQFELVEERKPRLQQFKGKINTLSNELADAYKKQATLEEDICKAETFLAENPLPSDKQPRLTQAKELRVELRSQRQQQADRLNSQSEHTSEINRLKRKLSALSEDQEKLLEDKVNAGVLFSKTETELKACQATGNLEDWQDGREQSRQALSIAQRYETSHEQLCNEQRNAAKLQECITALDESLNDLKEKLEIQTHLCTHADAEVTKFKAEKELALLAHPINQLRRQLKPGEPCHVCGSTEHPCADEVELDSEEQLEIAQKTLDAAEKKAQEVQEQKKNIEQEQLLLQQDKTRAATQIDTCKTEIKRLKGEIESARTQWQALYETVDISSEWVEEKITEADTAIDDLNNAGNAYKEASYKLKEVSEKLTTCERDIARENKLLEDNQQKLDAVTVEIENLTTDIENSVTRLRELLPDTFDGIDIGDAVNQFADKIETTATYEQERDEKQKDLTDCNSLIREKEGSLKTTQDNHGELQAEIEEYRNKRNGFLDAARSKTGGLATEEEIDAAIKRLHATIQSKADRRDEADQKLRKSRDQHTDKQADLRNCQHQQVKRSKDLGKAQAAYFEKLSAAGFDSAQAHDNASLTDSEIQQIQKEIDDYIQEKNLLEEEIAILRTQFEEVPFDPQVLERITAQVEEIKAQVQEVQRDIVVKQIEIAQLTDALSKREALDDKIQEAAKELNRWTHLKSAIGENKLFNFASNIILRQVNRLANEQLDFLSSGRYQLKAEGIDEKLKLTVIDRWNANEERPVETLSGGESFLTSLALALALSELSRGRAQINSFFLDEGFGTLDSETLDVAIAALEGLQMQGRSIFLISHIGELTRRIPVQIAVEKMGNGSSEVKIRG